jgi:hypothetical protein
MQLLEGKPVDGRACCPQRPVRTHPLRTSADLPRRAEDSTPYHAAPPCWHRFFAYRAHETSQLRILVRPGMSPKQLNAPKGSPFEADTNWHAPCIACAGKWPVAAVVFP